MSRIVLAATTDIIYDQRVHRMALTLHGAGHQVTVVCRRRTDISLGERPYNIRRMNMLFSKGKWFYAEFNFRLFLLLLFKGVDVITANDLDTLPASSWASRLRGKKLVFDAHELFTDVPELISRHRTRAFWTRLEKKLVPRVKFFMTVNESLADVYYDRYGIRPVVVRNLPLPLSQPVPVRDTPGKILIYQGALNKGRGVERLIRSLEFLPGYQLWICGLGSEEAVMRKQAAECGHSDRITFHGLVPLDELAKLTQQASLGFSLELPLGENYRLALPNKLFDYIQCGVPVLVSDLPEMRRIVDEYKVGRVSNSDPEKDIDGNSLAVEIKGIIENPVAWKGYHDNCRLAAGVLNWKKEEVKVIQVYEAALK